MSADQQAKRIYESPYPGFSIILDTPYNVITDLPNHPELKDKAPQGFTVTFRPFLNPNGKITYIYDPDEDKRLIGNTEYKRHVISEMDKQVSLDVRFGNVRVYEPPKERLVKTSEIDDMKNEIARLKAEIAEKEFKAKK